MASLSYEMMQDLIKIREHYYDNDNYEAAGMADVAESHIDGISKRHLPGPDYLNELSRIFESIKDRASAEEIHALDDLLALVDSYRRKYSI